MAESLLEDAGFKVLAAVSASLRDELVVEGAIDPWEGSPFAWIKALPSRTKGMIGERLVANWCAGMGLDVQRSPNSDADRMIAGRRIEIKFSTLWKSGGYTFQQLRNQDYEYAILLGISPDSASCWVLPKDVALRMSTPQHGGASGTDTRWISFRANNPPDWIAPFGGTLSEAYSVLKTIQRPVLTDESL
jgi:hypothetical protein